jgi:integrase
VPRNNATPARFHRANTTSALRVQTGTFRFPRFSTSANNFELADGKRERVRKVSPVQSRRGAEEFERQIRQTLLDGSYFKPAEEVKEVPTFDGFKDRFLTYSEVNNKPSTVYAKKWMLKLHLSPYFGATKLDEIGPAEIEAFKAKKLAEGQSKKSINNMLAGLRKLLNLAVEWEVIGRAPKVKGFRFKSDFISEDQFLSFDEAERFLRAAAPEWKALLNTALKTGLRVGELLALKWEDVDLVAGQLVVRRTLWHNQEGPPKGGRNRKVPLSDDAVAVLKAHRHLKGPYVFCETDGRRLTHSRVKDVVPSTCRKAQLAKRLTTHGLRHTFASHLVMRGVSLMAVKELLGHESIEMTLRYSHLSPDVKRDAVKLLDAPATPSNGTLTAPEASR